VFRRFERNDLSTYKDQIKDLHNKNKTVLQTIGQNEDEDYPLICGSFTHWHFVKLLPVLDFNFLIDPYSD